MTEAQLFQKIKDMQITHVEIPAPNGRLIKCRIVKLVPIRGGENILKLRVGKSWPKMDKYIYRSMGEIF